MSFEKRVEDAKSNTPRLSLENNWKEAQQWQKGFSGVIAIVQIIITKTAKFIQIPDNQNGGLVGLDYKAVYQSREGYLQFSVGQLVDCQEAAVRQIQ